MIPAFSLILALCLVGSLGLVAPVLLRLFKKAKIEEITPEWLDAFSVSRYRPMLRLLSDEDFAFLSRQPGFDPALYKKLRRERLEIFRQYFHRLIADFNRLHRTARLIVAHAESDHSALASQLMGLQLRFSLAVLETQVRFTLCKVGIGTVDVRVLLASLESLSLQLSENALASAAV